MPRLWQPPENYQPTPFAQLLIDIMRQTFLPPAHIAHRAGISPTTMMLYLNGTMPRDRHVLEKFSRAFNIPLGTLYEAAGFYYAPPAPAPAPAPIPAMEGDQWDDMIARIRHLPISPADQDELIQMTLAKRAGYPPDPAERYVAEEHRVVESSGMTDTLPTFPALPAVPRTMPRQQPAPSQRPQEEKPRRENHPSKPVQSSRRQRSETEAARPHKMRDLSHSQEKEEQSSIKA